jgi:hypothetical protein
MDVGMLHKHECAFPTVAERRHEHKRAASRSDA